MRVIAALSCVFLVTASSKAAPATLMDDYAAATQAFMGGLIDNRQWIETYRNHIVTNLAGKWVPLTLTRPETMEDIKKICTASYNLIATTSPFVFTINRHFNKDVSLDYSYTFVVGNTFAEHVDPEKLLGALGVSNAQGVSARLGVLSSANGHIGVFRPGENILVLQYPQRAPIIYGRCPG